MWTGDISKINVISKNKGSHSLFSQNVERTSDGVWNMPWVLNMLGFWIYQGFEYVSRSEYARALNIQGFLICQGFEYTRVLNMSMAVKMFSDRVLDGVCF